MSEEPYNSNTFQNSLKGVQTTARNVVQQSKDLDKRFQIIVKTKDIEGNNAQKTNDIYERLHISSKNEGYWVKIFHKTKEVGDKAGHGIMPGFDKLSLK